MRTDSEQSELDHVEEAMAKWREFDRQTEALKAKRAHFYTGILWAVLILVCAAIVWEMRRR